MREGGRQFSAKMVEGREFGSAHLLVRVRDVTAEKKNVSIFIIVHMYYRSYIGPIIGHGVLKVMGWPRV